MAVLEGDYADLCSLGLPLALSLQLQLLDLKLSGALWSAKASTSGFSVSLYWPTTTRPAVSPGGSENVEKPSNRQFLTFLIIISSNVTKPSAPALATQSESTVTPPVATLITGKVV